MIANAESLIRCDSTEDRTNGFFVSCFIKKSKRDQSLPVEDAQPTKRPLEDGDTPAAAKPKKKRKKKK